MIPGASVRFFDRLLERSRVVTLAALGILAASLAACDDGDDTALADSAPSDTASSEDTAPPGDTADTAGADTDDTAPPVDTRPTDDLDPNDATDVDDDAHDTIADTADTAHDSDTADDGDIDPDGDVVDPEQCAAPPDDLPAPQVDRYGRWDVVEVFPGDTHGLAGRKVEIFLPADYDTSSGVYPVLYMHDGQNLFDADQAAFGVEWQVDEALDALVADGTLAQPWIVVAIHATADRIADYTPDVDPEYGGGRGDDYLALLTERVMPWVESRYRVRCGARNTAIAGSSLGGLISFHAGLEHPDLFGRVAAISPSLWWNERSIVTRFDGANALPERLWLDAGSAEGSVVGTGETTTIANINAVRDRALALGAVYGQDVAALEVVGGEHNEAAWAARLPAILAWLLTDADLSGATAADAELHVYDAWFAPGEARHAALELEFAAPIVTRVTWPPSDTVWIVRDAGVVDASGADLQGVSVGATFVTAAARGGADETWVEVDDDLSDATVRFEVVVPAATSATHISADTAALGNFDGVGQAMNQAAADVFTLEVEVPIGTLEYKYTQGSWATVEKGPNGEELANRTWLVDGPAVVEDVVASWAN